MVQKKDSLIRKMLKRHEEFFDEKTGVSVANDFLQLSKIMEEMRAIEDKRVFHVLYPFARKASAFMPGMDSAATAGRQ